MTLSVHPIKWLRHGFERAPRPLRDGAVLALTVIIALLDLTTPTYVSVTGLYFLPIFLAAWYCKPLLSVFVVLAGSAVNLYVTSRGFVATAQLWQVILTYVSIAIVFFAFAFQMRSLKQAFARLETESRTDPLTGLRSRRSFFEIAEKEVARAARYGHGLTMALIDLDNFKEINDTQGHSVGDALLVEVGRGMQATLREVDVVARMGGDEFVVMLPEADMAEATQILERLLGRLRPLLKAFGPRTSASIGAVSIRRGGQWSVADLLARADAVMYSVKRGAKDDLVVEDLDTPAAAVPCAEGGGERSEERAEESGTAGGTVSGPPPLRR